MSQSKLLECLIEVTSQARLRKHCNAAVEMRPLKKLDLNSTPLSRVSVGMLWGDLGIIILKAHFTVASAVSWASHAMDRVQDPVSSGMGVDFVREFTNLHAGAVRGTFEDAGVLMGVSLPFVMTGDSERVMASLRKSSTSQTVWELTDGQHSIVCTCEIDIQDESRIGLLRDGIEMAIQREQKIDDAGDGDVEFMI